MHQGADHAPAVGRETIFLLPVHDRGDVATNRTLTLTKWVLREPALRRVSYLVFFVLLFSLVSSVVRSGGGGAPASSLAAALAQTASRVVRAAYPFLLALVAILATLSIAVQREAGGLAAIQTLGFRRWQVVVSHTLAVLVLLVVPALVAFLVLPPLVDPQVAAGGHLLLLYPAEYWSAMPRLFLAVAFLGLFAMAFVLILRRPAVAFGALVTFFFIGWFLQGPLGAYAVATPPGAFGAAYQPGVYTPEGIPLDGALLYVPYLVAAGAAYVVALFFASRRGEFG